MLKPGTLIPGSRVWVQDVDEVWIPGEVVDKSLVAVKTCKGVEKRALKPTDVVHMRNIDPVTGQDVGDFFVPSQKFFRRTACEKRESGWLNF